MKKANFFQALAVLALFLILPTLVSASEFRQGDFVRVPADEIIEGNLYTAASDINIEGEITGDLICATAKLSVSGKIGGDIICVASESDVSAEVAGSVRLISNTSKISGVIARNVFQVAQKFYLEDESVVGQDLLFAGDHAYSNGKINGDLWGIFSKLELKGQVLKNLNIKMDDQINKDEINFKIYPEAKVGGDIAYTAYSQAEYADDSVSGQVIHNAPEQNNLSFWAWLQKRLFKIFSALVIALVLSVALKNNLPAITEETKNNFWKIFWPGIFFIFVPPIAFIILLVTIIGIPLSVVALLLWLPALYIAQILTAMVLGQAILVRFREDKATSAVIAMLIGVPILWLIYALPFLGFLAGFAACVIGLGIMWHYLKSHYNNK